MSVHTLRLTPLKQNCGSCDSASYAAPDGDGPFMHCGSDGMAVDPDFVCARWAPMYTPLPVPVPAENGGFAVPSLGVSSLDFPGASAPGLLPGD